MRLLSIDPGISTGWAIIRIDEETMSIESSGTASVAQLDYLLWDWTHEDTFDAVVIEYLLTLTNSALNRQLTVIATKLVAAFPNAYSIRPGHWKPVTGDLPVPDVGTKHTKDAMRMAAFWARSNVSAHVGFALDSPTVQPLP